MYICKVKVLESPIEGNGVFTQEDIAKDTIVWIFKDGYDLSIAPAEYEVLPSDKQKELKKTGYLSPWTNVWIFPPKDDPAQYTNHSTDNNLTAVYDIKVSTEPYFVANRNIVNGEELTNNYHEFDQNTQTTKPDWAR